MQPQPDKTYRNATTLQPFIGVRHGTLVSARAAAVARPCAHHVRRDDALEARSARHLDARLRKALDAAGATDAAGAGATLPGSAAPHAGALVRLQDGTAAAGRKSAATARRRVGKAADSSGQLTERRSRRTYKRAWEGRGLRNLGNSCYWNATLQVGGCRQLSCGFVCCHLHMQLVGCRDFCDWN